MTNYGFLITETTITFIYANLNHLKKLITLKMF